MFAAWKTGALKNDSIRRWLDDLGAGSGQRPSDEEKLARLLIRRLQKEMPEDVERLLEHYAGRPVRSFRRQMLSQKEIEQLRSNRVALGRTVLPTDLSQSSMKVSLRKNSKDLPEARFSIREAERKGLRHFVSPRLIFEKGDRNGAQQRLRVDVFQ